MGCLTLIAAVAVIVSAFSVGPLLTLGWVGVAVVLIVLANLATPK